MFLLIFLFLIGTKSVLCVRFCRFCVDTLQGCAKKSYDPIQMNCETFKIINGRNIEDYMETPLFWKDQGSYLLDGSVDEYYHKKVACLTMTYQTPEKTDDDEYYSSDDNDDQDVSENYTLKSCVFKEVHGEPVCLAVHKILKLYNVTKHECCTCDTDYCNSASKIVPQPMSHYICLTILLKYIIFQ